MIRAWGLVRHRLLVRETWSAPAAGAGIRVGPLRRWLDGEHAVLGRSSPAVLKGRFDRGETQKERLRIIDYKTGGFQYSPGCCAPAWLPMPRRSERGRIPAGPRGLQEKNTRVCSC